MRPLRLILLLWLSILLAPVRPVAAQDVAALIGQPVVSVRFEVDGRPEESPAVLSVSDVGVGAPLRLEDIRSTVAHLDGLNLYDDIEAIGTPVPGGVDVLFRLVPRHPINRLVVGGNAGMSTGALRDAVLQRYGGVPTGVRVQAIEDTALQLMSDAGYLSARVSSDTERTYEPDAATLVLTVEAGPLARIASTDVEVRGTSPFSRDAIVDRTGTAPGEAYRRRALEQALSGLEEDLRARGFYEAQATFQVQVAGTDVALHIVVDVGPRVTLVVRPENALPSGGVDELIPIRRLGSADQDLLEDSRRRIEEGLRREGYWRASAPFTRELREDENVLVITYDVTRGPRFFVDRIELPAALAIPGQILRALIDIEPGDQFDESAFTAGLVRVANAYLENGYYQVSVTPAYEEVSARTTATEAWVALYPQIVEGPRGLVSAVTFTGLEALDESQVRAVMTSAAGRPYVAAEAARDQAAIRTLYLDRGFRSAAVAIEPAVDDEGRTVALHVDVAEGPQVLIGSIIVVGNERISTRAIVEELGLTPGEPAGQTALENARQRVVEMGVFRRIVISSDVSASGDRAAQIVVRVVEAPDTTLGFGGGLEGGRALRESAAGGLEDYLQFSPRGFFEISRRNLGGRNRSVSFFSRVSFRPRSAPGDPTRDGRGFGFTEYRVNGTYRERHALSTDLDLLVGLTSEQAIRTGFNFIRNSANAEFLRSLTPGVSWSGRYSLEFTRVFDTRLLDERVPIEEQPLIDRLFPQVRLSVLGTGVSWDRRDNPLATTRGTFVTADAEVASRSLGSEVGYLKTFFQASGFHALDASARTVLAVRGELGLARGFRRVVPEVDEHGQPVLDEHGQPVTDVVQDLPASSRFFAGGGTTVRGFQLDRLGVSEILNADGLSLGGNGLVVLNAEVRQVACDCRTPVGRTLTVVGFADGGNVFARASQLDLRRLRGAAGFGVRYDSPLGPLRFDVGFKLSPMIVGGRRENRWEYHLSIGEAF